MWADIGLLRSVCSVHLIIFQLQFGILNFCGQSCFSNSISWIRILVVRNIKNGLELKKVKCITSKEVR